jgi:hypothetical protein
MSFPVLHLIVFLPLGAAIVVAPELDAGFGVQSTGAVREPQRGDGPERSS